MSIELYNDKALFASISGGDEKAFGIFFHKYRLKIYTFILHFLKSKSLAEELTHDVFLGIWTQQHRLAEVKSPRHYLFGIVYHKVYTCLKQEIRERKKKQTLSATGISHITQEMLDVNESRQLVYKAIQQLPPQRKKIYLMRHEEDMSYEHIARILNISLNTVRNQLVEAAKSIRRYIQGTGLFLLLLKHWL